MVGRFALNGCIVGTCVLLFNLLFENYDRYTLVGAFLIGFVVSAIIGVIDIWWRIRGTRHRVP